MAEPKPGKLKPLEFDWDRHNREKNWQKHRINYHECEQVFFNKPIKFFPDAKHSEKEIRLVAYGKTNKNLLLAIVFTIRNKKIRVISARLTNKKERKIYDQ